MSSPEIDIIIVNYNSTDHLLRSLQSISDAAQGVALKVWVQDNNSKDDVGRVKSLFPEVTLTKNSVNLGFARAVNQALVQGEAPYILILNPDTLVNEGFFENAVAFMDGHEGTGIMGPRILDGDGTIQGSARLFPNLMTALFGRKSLLSRLFPNNPVTRENILTAKSDGVTPMAVDWVSGACMLVRRKAIQDVGPMDPGFFMYWEDADWCRRMWLGEWKVVYFPKPGVIHFVGVSSEKAVVRSVVAFHRSIYRLFKKHTRRPVSYLTPIVYWGLVYRLMFVLSSQWIHRLFHGLKGPIRHATAAVTARPDARIKVIRFIARLNIGGPSIHVHLLTTGLNKTRFHSVLVTGKISPQEGDMSYLFDKSPGQRPMIIRELQREISPAMDLKAFLQILRVLYRERPDIVHTHTAKAGTSARLAAILYNFLTGRRVHMVHTFHGHVFEGYFNPAVSWIFIWIERLLAMKTDVIVSISETQKQDLSEKFQIAPAARIKNIPLGFNLKPFLESDALKGRFREGLKISDDVLLVGIVGRLVPVKRHELFFDAARIFLDAHPDVKVKFVVVGDGELRESLERYVRREGLSPHVVFCGWRRDLPEVYADLNILSLTSVNEGTPVSVIEAMAASTPVIATDAGGVSDLLSQQNRHPDAEDFVVCRRGILCRKEDARGFAMGLAYLVDMNADEKKALIKESRAFVEERFSEGRLLRDIETLYLELVERPTGRH